MLCNKVIIIIFIIVTLTLSISINVSVACKPRFYATLSNKYFVKQMNSQHIIVFHFLSSASSVFTPNTLLENLRSTLIRWGIENKFSGKSACHGVTCRRWDALRTVSCGAKFDVELIGLRSSVSMRWPKVVWWLAVLVVVTTVTATMVYLGHAIDFHVGLATSSLLEAKSETKRCRNRVEKFFRNPAYIRYRICVRITALTCSIGI